MQTNMNNESFKNLSRVLKVTPIQVELYAENKHLPHPTLSPTFNDSIYFFSLNK